MFRGESCKTCLVTLNILTKVKTKVKFYENVNIWIFDNNVSAYFFYPFYRNTKKTSNSTWNELIISPTPHRDYFMLICWQILLVHIILEV